MRVPFAHPIDDPVHAALAVSWATVVWSTTTGSASAVVGLLTHSLSLAGLGVTVLIDVVSSVVLIWRFGHERRGGSTVDRAERVAHQVASGALAVFAVVLSVGAARNLFGHAIPTASVASVALAAAGLVVLPLLARCKYQVALAVDSAALRADAHITAVGAAVAGATLTGLVVVALWGWWWADAVAALILAAVAARQGWRGLSPRGATGSPS